MAYWNANGLKGKKHLLLDFAFNHDLDVILVNETHLRTCDSANLPNYAMYRSDRDGKGGGTAVYIKRSIEHHEVALPQLHQIEATAVAIHTSGHGWLQLSSAYLPPGKLIIQDDLTSLLSGPNGSIVAGDFNAKHTTWNCQRNNAQGRTLFDFAHELDFAIDAPTDPTHYSYAGTPTFIDVALLKDVHWQHRLTTACELTSDHLPVLMYIGNIPHDRPNTTRSKVVWPVFQDHLLANMGDIPIIDTTSQLDDYVEALHLNIQASIQYATNAVPVADLRNQLPPHLKQLIKDKNRARKLAQRTHHPVDKSEYQRLKSQVTNEVKEHKDAEWTSKLEALSFEDSSSWKFIKNFRTKRTPMPALLRPDGTQAKTDKDKADALAASLQLQCAPNTTYDDPDHIQMVEDFVKEALNAPDESTIEPASFKEVRSLIRQAKIKSAPGPDGITHRALKELPRKAITAITTIVNAALRLRHFPKLWKHANVIVIHKQGQPKNQPKSYRPISLLSTIGKIAEKIILNRLKKEMDSNKVVPDEQFGFREGHSTTHQILRIVEQISKGFSKKECTVALLLDISKAFDSVWHPGLLYKMLRAGIKLAIVKLIHSYLAERTFCIAADGTKSEPHPMNAGVPQGSPLSAPLYNIYMSDIPKPIHPQVNNFYFADDTAVASTSISPDIATQRVQDVAEQIEQWMGDWRIGVNTNKSVAIIFARCKKRTTAKANLWMNGSLIQWQKSAKYLGVTMDQKLNWGQHITNITNKSRGTMSQLYSLVGPKSKMSPANKLRVYKTIIRPALTYAAPAWGHAAKTHINKIESIQNKLVRYAWNPPRRVTNVRLRNDSKLTTVKKFIRNHTEKFYAKSEDHQNPLINQLGKYDKENHPKYKMPREIIDDADP